AQMSSMFTVIDNSKHSMISYMEQDGNPVAMAYQLPEIDEASDDEQAPDFTVTELPDKTFLGYPSKGMQLEDTEHCFIVYIAKDTPVGFGGMFDAQNGEQVPEGFKDIMGEYGNALMMYAKVIDKNDADNNMEMECISLEEAMMVKK